MADEEETVEETTLYDRAGQIVPEALADEYAIKGRTVIKSAKDGHLIEFRWFDLEGSENLPIMPTDEELGPEEEEPSPAAGLTKAVLKAKVDALELEVVGAKTAAGHNAALDKLMRFIAGAAQDGQGRVR